jgi:hypothetical protein
MLTISEMDMIKLPIQFSLKRRIHSTHRATTPMLTRKVRAYTVPEAKIRGVKAATMPRKKQELKMAPQSPRFFFSLFMLF